MSRKVECCLLMIGKRPRQGRTFVAHSVFTFSSGQWSRGEEGLHQGIFLHYSRLGNDVVFNSLQIVQGQLFLKGFAYSKL